MQTVFLKGWQINDNYSRNLRNLSWCLVSYLRRMQSLLSMDQDKSLICCEKLVNRNSFGQVHSRSTEDAFNCAGFKNIYFCTKRNFYKYFKRCLVQILGVPDNNLEMIGIYGKEKFSISAQRNLLEMPLRQNVSFYSWDRHPLSAKKRMPKPASLYEKFEIWLLHM